MMDEKISRIKKKLKDKYYHTNDSWLDDCLDYYFSENPEANDEQTLTFVTNQWQLSDLREIANEKGCLPNNIAQQKSTLLPGKYILQVEKGYDIATSKYKQLEAIRKISNENIAVTETEQTQPWEVKSKRMMELSLTDGIQDVKAIEYKPIGFLKDVVLPGFKIMIKGPVQCRRGVILMTTANIEDVGGEVEPLLIKNAKENVLARALGLEENPDPYSTENESAANNEAAEDPSALFEDDFDINLEEVSALESQPQKKSHISTNKHNNDQSKGRMAPKTGGSSGNGVTAPRNLITPIDKRRSVADLPVCFEKTEEHDSIEFPDDDEDFTDFKVPDVPHRVGDNEDKPSTSSLNPSAVVEDNEDLIFLEEEQFSRGCVPAASGNPAQEGIDDDFGNVDWDDYDLEEVTEKAIQESLNTPKPQNERKILQPVASDQNRKKKAGQSSNMMSFVKKDSAKAESPVQTLKKRPSEILTSPSSSSKIPCNRDTPKSVKSARSITDFFKKTDTAKSPTKPPPQPKLCDFIIEMEGLSLTEGKITKKIWGRVESMGKLQTVDGNWALDCTISDRTGSLKVQMAPMLLEKAIGYSATKFMELKKLRKKNPEIDSALRKALRNADEQMKNLDALLDVEFSFDAIPKIVKITELTHAERETIRSCRNRLS